MLKMPSNYEQSYFVRPNSSFSSPVSPALLLDGSAGMIARELWWINHDISPVNTIPPWFSMFIYYLGDKQ
jgi:hypothetical protein